MRTRATPRRSGAAPSSQAPRGALLASALAAALGCSLERAPLVERGAMDAGVDARRAPDAGAEDTPASEVDAPALDAPPAPADAPDPCLSCPIGTRCDVAAVCSCDPALCAATGECVGEVCEACGGRDERCCAGDRCSPGNRCMGGRCVEAGGSCGGLGQPCCTGVTCDGGAECIGGVCATGRSCGGPTEPCCTGSTCVTGQLCRPELFGPDRCRPCGAPAEPCCPVGPACRSTSCVEILLVGRICGV
jgi:hypothetical protein